MTQKTVELQVKKVLEAYLALMPSLVRLIKKYPSSSGQVVSVASVFCAAEAWPHYVEGWQGTQFLNAFRESVEVSTETVRLITDYKGLAALYPILCGIVNMTLAAYMDNKDKGALQRLKEDIRPGRGEISLVYAKLSGAQNGFWEAFYNAYAEHMKSA